MYDRAEICCAPRFSCKSASGTFARATRPFDRTPGIGLRGIVAPMAATGQIESGSAGRTVLGHPIGLTNLFGVELWERFSFYGMLTILG